MAETSYIIAVLATVFIITFGLRALPFAALKTLRQSKIVKVLSWWMPVGILGILAASTLRSTDVMLGDAPDTKCRCHPLIALRMTPA